MHPSLFGRPILAAILATVTAAVAWSQDGSSTSRSSEKLDLSRQELRTVPPAVLAARNVRQLSLSANRLEVLPAELATLRSLEVLDVSGNHLTRLQATLAELPALKELNISHNPGLRLPLWLQRVDHHLTVIADSSQIVEIPDGVGRHIQIKLASRGAVQPIATDYQRARESLARCRQLVMVRSGGWSSPAATVTLWERTSASDPWVQRAKPIDAMVGRNGLGWGLGEHGWFLGAGPIKREGDGRAPAGLFRITEAFYDSSRLSTKPATGLPDRRVGPKTLYVDDPNSRYYNRFVEAGETASDWFSHEDMQRKDELYKIGLVVAHNTPEVAANLGVPALGSAIFLHTWRGRGQPTSGCTAMDYAELQAIYAQLDAKKNPQLLQLPEAEFLRCVKELGLPAP